MSAILRLLRRIGGTKGTPGAATAGQIAMWKANTTPTGAVSLYVHDGVQWVEVLDTNGEWQPDVTGAHVYRPSGNVGFRVAAPIAPIDLSGAAVQNVAVTTGGMDLSIAQMFTATPTVSTRWGFINVPVGRGVTVVLHLTNGGIASQIWDASIKWPGGVAPTLTAAGTDVLVFVTHDGGTTWRGNIFAKDLK